MQIGSIYKEEQQTTHNNKQKKEGEGRRRKEKEEERRIYNLYYTPVGRTEQVNKNKR